MLQGVYDTQCAFKCFRCADLLPILAEVRSLGADFDMELLLCALTKFSAERKGPDEVLCDVSPTLFTEDFAESNFMASADDEDKPYKTYAGMNKALVEMHQRYVARDSADAAAAAPLVEFCSGLQWEGYKRMVLALEARLGPTLFDKDFTLDELKAAAAE